MPNPIYCTTICIRDHKPELLSLHLYRLSKIAIAINVELDISQLKKTILVLARHKGELAVRISITKEQVLGFDMETFAIRSNPIQAKIRCHNTYKKTLYGKEKISLKEDTYMYYDEQGLLEGSWFNIFVENEYGCILTPPLGKIIAGTMRSAVLYTLHRMQLPYKIVHIDPNNNETYFATTALRILQPINQRNVHPNILEIQQKTKQFIKNNELDIYNFWISEIQTTEYLYV